MASQSSVEFEKDSAMDIAGLRENDESSWMSQLFGKLDLEVDEEDICLTEKMTKNDAHSLKKDEHSQKWGIASSDKKLSEHIHTAVRALTLLQEDLKKHMHPPVCALILLHKDEEKPEEPMTDPDDYLSCHTHTPTGTGFENSTCSRPNRTLPVPHSRPLIGARYLASNEETKEYYNTKRRLTYGGRPQNEMDRMTDECLLAFKNYVQDINLKDNEYKFGELCCRCYRFQAHGKIYQHFNFTMQTKLRNSGIWTSKLYFSQVEELSGVKYYFCCTLEATDNGDCYECERQQIGRLKHPRRGGYEEGCCDRFNLQTVGCSTDSDEDRGNLL
uniref:Uncharacterized protein n=1 Tax=Avena sativa TaxID=4498 RepID=A0ACD5YIS8_AVESA